MGAPAQGRTVRRAAGRRRRVRAIKRHLAACTDALPWLFISERGQPLTRQAVNYLIATAAERAGLPRVHPRARCAILAASRWLTRATASASSRTTSAIAIQGTPFTTPARRVGASRDYGNDLRWPSLQLRGHWARYRWIHARWRSVDHKQCANDRSSARPNELRSAS
jgi:hypothetical protein